MANRSGVRGKLTVYGRQLLVHRIVEQGYPAARAAAMQGVSRSCAYRWVARWRAEGGAGLVDRSHRPHRSPQRCGVGTEQRILAERAATNLGPHRLAWRLGLARSTVYAVLRRHHRSRLDHLDRPTGQPVRYQRDRPGELVHVDVKKVGRVPHGGGWRVHGRSQRPNRKRGAGYDYVHACVDDRTRLAYLEVLADERGQTAAGFLERAGAWFAAQGITIERVMTDNAQGYRTSRAFAGAVADLAASHKLTRPYRPQTNGKVERVNRTLADEWAYARPYTSNLDRQRALHAWLEHYNHHRPHWAHNGQAPMDALNQLLVHHVPGKHT